MHELRCPSRIQGRITDEGHLEVKCQSRFCGARSGVVVLHLFDLSQGNLISTTRFKAPQATHQKGSGT